ncbi:MAG: hypothetical protein LBV69_08245 [Bacteroidales bacterium]|jgi:hypothetical protein|nr:hypothetical protein [Bacteroidales bacterium]
MTDFEDQLESIRMKLYEQTKDMEKIKAIEFVNNEAKKIGEKYGFKIIKTDEILPENIYI